MHGQPVRSRSEWSSTSDIRRHPHLTGGRCNDSWVTVSSPEFGYDRLSFSQNHRAEAVPLCILTTYDRGSHTWYVERQIQRTSENPWKIRLRRIGLPLCKRSKYHQVNFASTFSTCKPSNRCPVIVSFSSHPVANPKNLRRNVLPLQKRQSSPSCRTS